MAELTFQVLVYREVGADGAWWIAQCLEHDVCVQAQQKRDLPDALMKALISDFVRMHREGVDPRDPANWSPPPAAIQALWVKKGASMISASVPLENLLDSLVEDIDAEQEQDEGQRS